MFMDLSFLRAGGLTPANARVTGWPRVPVWPFLRAATAAAQAASPTAQASLRGQDGGDDWVQELADVFAPRSGGMIEAVRLSGSFNPVVAGRLYRGQEE